MSTNDKAVSKTKLVVIDTTIGVAKSFEGNFECGEAHLPDEFYAAEMIEQLNEFRLAADGARAREQQETDRKIELGKVITSLSNQYSYWFDLFHPEEQDTFGL